MRLLTWNIQWGLGADGRVDLDRIVAEVQRLGDPDVICLQEVTAGFSELDGNDGTDQFAYVAQAFPGHQAIAAPVVDFAGPNGTRKMFGNMLLSRYSVGPIERHRLPWRNVTGRECMPRGLLSAVVATPAGHLRIMTTHLEWSVPDLRMPQIDAVRSLHEEACHRIAVPAAPGTAGYAPQPTAQSAILAGDFNMPPQEATRARLMAPFTSPLTPRFVDAFEASQPGRAHPDSMCLFDRREPARCVDYVFCTEDMVHRIVRITYDHTSQASDHQPVILELA